eukprot:2900504-Prymnesium_polylepis.1
MGDGRGGGGGGGGGSGQGARAHARVGRRERVLPSADLHVTSAPASSMSPMTSALPQAAAQWRQV